MTEPRDPLDVGLAAAFGPDSAPATVDESVLHALGFPAGSLPRVQLRDPSTEPVKPVLQPGSPEIPAAETADRGGRYQFFGEIARGGMGAVLKGRDTDLGRDIAVKVLLEAHQGKPELLQRFVEEAQIGGQLQHPGVVPVYALGKLHDGRPFFAMKLVKGRTLSTLLAERTDLAEDRPRFLAIFQQVCQTLAYAHARGVLHRDLKPSNVMVGAFGEVQVMDWGLAKVLAAGAADEQQPQPSEEVSVIRTVRSVGSGSESRAGNVLGTPAYMAPEQARGEVDRLDERCDVFGLGALLCQILTGQPPYTGGTGEEVHHKAAAADTAAAMAWLAGCGADAELIALAQRCLTAEPKDRPRHAGEVAAAVTAYLGSVAERLRQAELARAAEAAQAEEAKATAAAERRARRLTLGLAASVLLLMSAGAGTGWLAQRQQAERAAADVRQRQAVEAALDRAQALRRQARGAEARTVLDQTRDRLGAGGPEDLRQRVARAAADLALVDRLEAIRLRRATVVEGRFDLGTADRDYAAAFRDAGLGTEGEAAAAAVTRWRASAVREQVVAAADDWVAVTADPDRAAWLFEVARRADPDPWRDRFRDPKVWRDRALLEELAGELLRDEAALAKQRPTTLAALGQALRAAKADAAPLLTAAQARYPGDFWLTFTLGNCCADGKRWDEAVGYYRGALAARPEAVAVRNNLGNALAAKGRLDEAIREYRAAIALDPKDAQCHNGLGAALKAQGQWDAAATAYRTAIALDPELAQPHNGLGTCLAAGGQWDAAITAYRAAITRAPQDAMPHNNLGNALRAKGQWDAAITAYHAASALEPGLPQPHLGLGLALQQRGDFAAALEALRRGHELGARQQGWNLPSPEWVRRVLPLAELDRRASAILKGEEKARNPSEMLRLGRFCLTQKKAPADAARLYAAAFAAEPELADDLAAGDRFAAARAAALAGGGKGRDAADLDAPGRARWRNQSLEWLRADLELWAKRLQQGDADDRAEIRRAVQRWQAEPALAGLRDEAARAKLPEAERAAWQTFWADVEAMRRQAEAPKKGDPHD